MRTLVSFVVVIAIFVGVLPRVAEFSQVWATIRAMTWLELGSLGAAAALKLLTHWLVLVAVLPGLRLRQAAVVNLTGGAISNAVPGGGALAVGTTYAMLASWGFTRTAIALSVLVSGVWSTAGKFGLPVLALALLAVQGRATTSLLLAGLTGLAALAAVVGVFAAALARDHVAACVGDALGRLVSSARRPFGRPPVVGLGDATRRFRAETVGLLRDRWPLLTAAQLSSHAALYLVLLAALRHVGVSNDEVGWAAVLATFALVRLVSAVPITPGGLGVVEFGLTAGLVLAGGDRAQVVAAVLVYRALTFLPTIPLGALAYLHWQRWRSWPCAWAVNRAPVGATTGAGQVAMVVAHAGPDRGGRTRQGQV